MEHWRGQCQNALSPAAPRRISRRGRGTYGDRVWYTPSWSADVDTLGRFRRARLIVAEFVSLHPYAHDLALVDVQPLGFGRIEQFVG